MRLSFFQFLPLLACASCANHEQPVTQPSILGGCATSTAAWSDAGALACPQTLAEYCGNSIGCPLANFADNIAQQNSTGSPPNIYICDSYNYVDIGMGCGDTHSVLYAFDKNTNQLLAAVEEVSPDGSLQFCLGGPPTIDRLGSCSAYYDCFPNDAGFSEGHCYPDAGVAGN